MALRVWDGERERTARTLLSNEDLSVHGIDFRFVNEQVDTPTDWCFQEPHHIVVVHRGGRLQSMEIEFERGPSCLTIPQVGDVWVIPAEHRYAALAQGDTVRFCEMTFPTGLFGDRKLTPLIRHRDPLLYYLIERMGAVLDRNDGLARLLIASLAEALSLHVTDTLAPHRPGRRRRGVLDSKMQAS